jgi:hypothetical protein
MAIIENIRRRKFNTRPINIIRIVSIVLTLIFIIGRIYLEG